MIPSSIRQGCQYEGKEYFVTTGIYAWGIFYRHSVFEALGLSPPDTWEGLLSVCDSLLEAGYTPFAMGLKYSWPAMAWLVLVDVFAPTIVCCFQVRLPEYANQRP
jgi:ABC-type glycerol-3-phosphate transport system substrate-binding protein